MSAVAPHRPRRRALTLAGLATASALGGLAGTASPAAAIVGGDEADPGEWPWQVVLFVDGDQWCGGSLLDADLVLTAAHCTDGVDASDFEVRGGSIEIDGGDMQRRRVDEIVQHEDYDANQLTDDISLLRLAEPFELDDALQPVTLPDADTAAELTDDGDPAFVTGFGLTDEDGEGSEVLLEGDIEIIADSECEQHYAEEGESVFGATQVCAGLDRGHVDACFGDSGGPLVVPTSGDGDFVQVGIVSWGDGCGRAERPTVYTQISAYLDWLTEQGVGVIDGERFASEGTSLRLPATGTRGKASSYPATIEVEGLDGDVQEVAVELRGLSHERPEDLDVWLRAPDGTTVTLLSDVGGNEPIEDRTVLLSDRGPAAGDGPFGLQLRPTDTAADDQRKGGAPASALAELEGIDPNGEWSLYVADDTTGSVGSLEGWTLIVR